MAPVGGVAHLVHADAGVATTGRGDGDRPARPRPRRARRATIVVGPTGEPSASSAFLYSGRGTQEDPDPPARAEADHQGRHAGTLPRSSRSRVGHRAADRRASSSSWPATSPCSADLMLEAYCWPPSVAPGEPTGLHVSTDAGAFDVEVAREGATREVVWRGPLIAAGEHATPADAASDGCDWPAAVEIPVGPWRSGYYSVTLTAGHRACRRVPGRAAGTRGRARADPAGALHLDLERLQRLGRPVALHRRQPRLVRTTARARVPASNPNRRDARCSPRPDREGRWFFEWAEPLGLSVWSGGAGWWNWERPFVRWAEEQGFGVDVAISQDLEQHPDVLEGHRLYASVGHDEYWSWGMRDALDGFTDARRQRAIFSGNTCFWQVRFDDDHRAMPASSTWRTRTPSWARRTSGSCRAVVGSAHRATRRRDRSG